MESLRRNLCNLFYKLAGFFEKDDGDGQSWLLSSSTATTNEGAEDTTTEQDTQGGVETKSDIANATAEAPKDDAVKPDSPKDLL